MNSTVGMRATGRGSDRAKQLKGDYPMNNRDQDQQKPGQRQDQQKQPGQNPSREGNPADKNAQR